VSSALQERENITGIHSQADGASRYGRDSGILRDGYNFSPERGDKAMEGFTVKTGQKTPERWF
jgi:hypothetical protein